MPLTVATQNTLLDTLNITDVSIHTSTPNSLGSNELIHQDYLRTPISFSTATNGEISANTTYDVQIPSGVTVSCIGFWSGTTFIGYETINEVFNNRGILSLDNLTIKLNNS